MEADLRDLNVASPFGVFEHEAPASVDEGNDPLDTCTLQAIKLRAESKMVFLYAAQLIAYNSNKSESK